MKRILYRWPGIVAGLIISIIFATVFVTYAQPMEDRMYDLSLSIVDDASFDANAADRLGWSVFTQTGDTVTPLTSNGYGSYLSLDYPGQTFYFSRVMTEQLDAATLQLGTADRNFSVFLDGKLIYTDCPELDNRIGYLTLPMHGWDRTNNVIISLPDGYVGKTLTIAQSTPENADTPSMATRAVPCTVKLYCGFAYESALIAESFQSAMVGAVGYVLGAAVLVIFAITLFRTRADTGLLFLALTVFLAMSARMYNTSYYLRYFGFPDSLDAATLLRQIMTITMLAFLSSRADRFKRLAWGMTGGCGVLLVVHVLLAPQYMIIDTWMYRLLWRLPEMLCCFSLIGMFIIAWLLRKQSRFHRFFAPCVTLCIAAYLLLQLLLPARAEYFSNLLTSLRTLTFDALNPQISWLMMAVSLVIVLIQFAQDELNQYAANQVVIDRSEMLRQSYENLRLHNEEVMMLRHDMNRHFQYLRMIANSEEITQYLDELISRNEKIRPVIQSGNEMLDIIIGSRAAIAAEHGVKLEIRRATAPEQLPLPAADLCSLLMNLLDNAVNGARDSGSSEPYILLDLHIKSDFFVFVCENAASPAILHANAPDALPKHGLGLKIIHQIADQYNILLRSSQTEHSHKVELAIPLTQPSK